MLSLSWLKTIALTPASCPTDPFLAPPGQLCPHFCPTPQTHHGRTSPQSLLSALHLVTFTGHTPDAQVLWREDRCTPEGPSSSCFPCLFHPPHSSQLQLPGLPRQLQSSASCPHCVLPSPPAAPSLGISEGRLAGSSC